MNFNEGVELIKICLSKPLPGEEAQWLMAPKSRKTRSELIHENSDYKISSVLMLLYPDEHGILKTIFIERLHDNTIHSGQIAFPGGKVEKSDDSIEHTALRETEEEIGVASSSIEIIGALTPLIIPASNFLVHPHIGVMTTTPKFLPNSNEVHSLLPTTISEILNLQPETGVFKTSYGELTAPYFPLMNHKLWGATSMMVSEFRVMVNEG